jgi:hypothetical protein
MQKVYHAKLKRPCKPQNGHAHARTTPRKTKKGPSIVVHHPDSVLEQMNDWCKEHHGKSGLTQRSRESDVGLAEAERRVLEFVQARLCVWEHWRWGSGHYPHTQTPHAKAMLLTRF